MKAKLRLVARGFKQRKDIDFGEELTGTDMSSCVCLLSAVACKFDLDVRHFDVDQVFVEFKQDREVFQRSEEIW